MRLIHSFLAALVTLTTLTACGTKTPLTMPPPELPAVKAAVPPTPTIEGIGAADLLCARPLARLTHRTELLVAEAINFVLDARPQRHEQEA